MTEPSQSTVERYRDAAIALLPPGRALAKTIGSNLSKLLEALNVESARIHEEADSVFAQRIPGRAVELLDEWEKVFGLPGPCVTTPTTDVAERQGAVKAKFRGRRGHNRPAFEQAAEALGYFDLTFVTYPPATCDSSCESSLYDDEWANAVRVYVPEAEQTARDSLACIFTDQLRRSHGFVGITFEGPMGADRNRQTLYNKQAALAADGVLASIPSIAIRYGGHLSLQCLIDTVGDGSGNAPSDTPSGVWELWCSADDATFTQLTGTLVTTELAKIAPNGNNKVAAWAVFDGIPGTAVKVRYNATSGGAGDSRVSLHAAVW